MGKKTINLTAPFSMRLRHEQSEWLDETIKETLENHPEIIEHMIKLDRDKFEQPQHTGRDPSLRAVFLRLALDKLLSGDLPKPRKQRSRKPTK